MLAIKLSRVGKKKQPQYRIVVVEKSKDPWGKVLEIVGFYNPLTNPKTFTLKKDRAEHWLKMGAQASDSVHNLFVREGIIKAEKHTKVHISKRHRDRLTGAKK